VYETALKEPSNKNTELHNWIIILIIHNFGVIIETIQFKMKNINKDDENNEVF